MNIENNTLSFLKNLSEEEKRSIAARQSEQRLEQSKKIQDLSNTEIAELEDFKVFCEQNGSVPTKRQASKRKKEFIKWYEEKKGASI